MKITAEKVAQLFRSSSKIFIFNTKIYDSQNLLMEFGHLPKIKLCFNLHF